MVEAGGLEHMIQVLLNKQLPANMFGSQKRKSPALGEAWRDGGIAPPSRALQCRNSIASDSGLRRLAGAVFASFA